jgi:hypothetical protein
MALTKIHTWLHSYRQITVSDKPMAQTGQTNFSPSHRANMWGIKEMFKTAGWTVVGSCGCDISHVGSEWTAGMDGVDRWINPDAVRVLDSTTTSWSWIVLRNAGINATGQGYQLLISFDGSVDQAHYVTLFDSWSAGFTGGSITARPTATDEMGMLNNQEYMYTRSAVYSGTSTVGIHGLWTSDGSMTRIFATSHEGADHYLNCIWCFERVSATARKPWWDKPYIAQVAALYYDNPGDDPAIDDTYSGGQTDNEDRMWTRVGDLKLRVCQSSEQGGIVHTTPFCALGEMTQCQAVDVGGDWIATRAGIVSLSPVCPGWLGRRDDIWFIPEVMATGDYLPTGTNTFLVLGDILIPTDGTLLLLD